MAESNGRASGFELEAASMEQFLELLEKRESEESPRADYEIEERSAIRRAVCISELYDAKGTTYGWPSIRRYVIASFSYGEDLVSCREDTSYEMEVKNMPGVKELAERQHEVATKLRAEITERIDERSLSVPVFHGFLHHAQAPRGEAS